MNKINQTKLQEIPNFVVFKTQKSKVNIKVFFANDTLWLTQKLMAVLFGVDVRTISEHLINVFRSEELSRAATIRKFRIVQKEGQRQVTRKLEYYNLDAIISVGYRVNSQRATQFRIWATKTLGEFMIKGFVIDDERLKQGRHFGQDYFEELLEKIREIRASERRFYKKIADIYALSADYDKKAKVTKNFFDLEQIVSAYLDLAENRAKRQIVMNMKDWVKFLNKFLDLANYPILQDKGKISQHKAQLKAAYEYKKFRIIQDQDYESDFDQFSRKYLEKK